MPTSEGTQYRKRKSPSSYIRDKAALLQRLQDLADARGGRLEEGQVYTNNSKPLIFLDKAGNRFPLTPVQLTHYNVWSPFEPLNISATSTGKLRKRKFTPKLRDPVTLLQRITDLAELYGGRLEEGQNYISNETPMFFIDKEGNRFSLKPLALLRKSWSPYEIHPSPGTVRRRKSAPKLRDRDALVQRLVSLASSHGGSLLEGQTYINNYSPLRFIDKGGREFSMTPELIVQHGLWSPHESKGTHDVAVRMERLTKKAQEWGGSIAAGEVYKGYTSKMKFIDSDGNEFFMSPTMVMNGWWSPYQAKMIRDKDAAMARLKKAVEARSGRIEDGQTYQGWDTPMWFIDSYGDRFQQTPSRVTSGGRWNAEEGGLIGESVCRQAISHLFGGVRFPSKWNVVRRPNGNKLQLDGYCEQLGIAFEYQGYLHETRELQMMRDKEKRKACFKKGILLVEIPELHKAKLSHSAHVLSVVASIVRRRLLDVGRSLEADWLREEGLKLDFSKIRVCDQRLEALNEFVAEHHPGWFIEEGEAYERHDVPLWFRHEDGRRFCASSSKIRALTKAKKPLLRAAIHEPGANAQDP